MGPDDAPRAAGSSRPAEVRRAEESEEPREGIQAEIEFLRGQLELEEGGRGEPNPNPEMRNHGQIAEMTLPTGWEEAPPYRFTGGIGTRSFRNIHPPEAPNAILGFYYRGLPINEEAGKSFHDILQRPPHVLTQEEFKSLSEVLRDKAQAEDFISYVARTEDWNGKRVLVVEGRYAEIQEDTIELFVDARRDGRVIQEIYFQAPKDVYLKYAKAARGAMKSIQWR